MTNKNPHDEGFLLVGLYHTTLRLTDELHASRSLPSYLREPAGLPAVWHTKQNDNIFMGPVLSGDVFATVLFPNSAV